MLGPLEVTRIFGLAVQRHEVTQSEVWGCRDAWCHLEGVPEIKKGGKIEKRASNFQPTRSLKMPGPRFLLPHLVGVAAQALLRAVAAME